MLEAIQAPRSPGTHKGEKPFEGKNVGRLIGRGRRTSFLCVCEGASSPLQGMLHSHNHKEEMGKASPCCSSVCEQVWTRSSHSQSPVSHLPAPTETSLDRVSSVRPSCIKFPSVPLIVSYLLLQICFTCRNESQLFHASRDLVVVSADTISLGAHAVSHPSVYPSKTSPCECCEFTAIASSLPRADFVYPLAIRSSPERF